MDFLVQNHEHVQERVFFSMANLLNLEVDLIYFDTTSTYFEVDPDPDEQEELRRADYSKDHRPDPSPCSAALAGASAGARGRKPGRRYMAQDPNPAGKNSYC